MPYLKFKSCLVAFGYYVCAQCICEGGNEGCRYHIGAQHTLETYSRCEHCDNLGVLGKLRGKIYYRNENKKRAECVGIIGRKVQVIVEQNLGKCCVGCCELVDFFIVVENDDYRDYKCQGEEICSQKLTYDV